jgi:hypothetical protein
MVAPVNNEQPTRQSTKLLPLTPRGQNFQVTSNDQSSAKPIINTSYIVTVSASANENVSGETKHKFFKKVFTVVVEYVAKPVAVGAKWVKNAAVDAFQALTGLLQKTNETTEEIIEKRANGDEKGAADAAKNFLKEELHVQKVDHLTDEEVLKLYYEYLGVIDKVSGLVGKVVDGKMITAENALDIIRQTTIEIRRLPLKDLHIAEGSKRIQKGIETVVKNASADEISKCSTSLTHAQNEVISLANTIKDKTLRASVLDQIKDSNTQIAQIIVNKLSEEPNRSELIYTFVEDVQMSKNVYHISCDLTETVVRMLLENRAEQNRLDAVAADKLAQNVQIEKKQDERTYLKKIADNRSELSKLQEKLGKLLYATPEDEGQINSQIIAEINKPKPLPLT